MVVLQNRTTGRHYRLTGDLEAAWDEEQNVLRQLECDHASRECRVRKISDGRAMVMDQCMICGEGKGNAYPKNEKTLASPPWDETLSERYKAERFQRFDAVHDKYLALAESEDRRLASKSSIWRKEYETYMRSEAWQRKRALVLTRAGGKCEGCMESPAEVVHHRTYQNMGNELLFELVALCNPCHDKAHPEHRESFYDVDYGPCQDCRMNEGGGSCGRFNRPQFEALSADGECGPRWKGFEGLK